MNSSQFFIPSPSASALALRLVESAPYCDSHSSGIPSPSASAASNSVPKGLAVPLGLATLRTTTRYCPVELLAALRAKILVVKKLTVSLDVLDDHGMEPFRHS